MARANSGNYRILYDIDPQVSATTITATASIPSPSISSSLLATIISISATVPPVILNPNPSTVRAITSVPAIAINSFVEVTSIAVRTSVPFALASTLNGGNYKNAWRFVDVVDGTIYDFELNPSDQEIDYEKNIVWSNNLGPNGRTLIFESQERPKELSLSGKILSQEQYETLEDWYNARHQIYITDDLGRKFLVYIREFSPQRERRFSHPWYHSYSIRAVVLSSV